MSDAMVLTLYGATWAAVWWAIHKWRHSRYQKRVIEDPDRRPPEMEDSFGISFVLMIVVAIVSPVR